MNIPNKSNPKWQDLITGYENLELKSLAFQMTLIRTKEQYNSGEIDLDKSVNQLYNFCIENQNGNNLLEDINTLFGDYNTDIQFVNEEPKTEEKPIEISEDIIINENFNINENHFSDNQKETLDTVLEDNSSAFKEQELEILNEFDNLNNPLNVTLEQKEEDTFEEQERLKQELEILNNKVKEVEKDTKKKNGFFRRLFK